MSTQWQYSIEQFGGADHTYKNTAGKGGLQMLLNDKAKAVSYTHLDVYKRQVHEVSLCADVRTPPGSVHDVTSNQGVAT